MRWRPPETVGGAWRAILLGLAGGLLVVAAVAAGSWWVGSTGPEPRAELPAALVEAETSPGSVSPTCASEPTSPSPEQRAPAPPTRVRIPALAVEARVVPVSLQGSVLVPPDDVTVVGWWDGGAMPGDPRGTVLLTGHSWSRGDGVFDRLGEAEVGDLVRLGTEEGTAVYRVVAVTSYSRAELADVAPRLFSADVQPRLVLTTCTDFADGVYRGTSVVVATPQR